MLGVNSPIRIITYLIIGSLAAVFLPQHLAAESPGRIIERITNDWMPPKQEDYHDFIYLLDSFTGEGKKYRDIENDKTLTSIKKLLNQSNISQATRAGLMIRLTQLYVQNTVKEREKAIKLYRKKYDSWLDLEARVRGEAPEADLATSQNYARKAIQAYRDLFNGFPKFNNDPELLYQMANLQLLVDNPNASLYYEKIIKQFSKSVWAKKSLLGLGEYFFAKKNLTKAAQFYTQGMKTGLVGITQYAQYKLSWVYGLEAFAGNRINREKVTKMEFLLRKIASKSGLGSANFQMSAAYKLLKRNATNDLIWLWSESFNFQSATTFFLNVANNKEAYFNTVERLGWKFELANNPQKAADFYHILFKKAPGRKNQIRLQLRLIELLFKNDKPIEVVTEVQDLAKTLSDKNGGWLKINRSNVKLQKQARVKAHQLIVEKSAHYYKLFNSSQKIAYLRATNILFALYIFLFPNGLEIANIRFNYAVTLEKLGKIEEAVLQYHIVAKFKKSNAEQRTYSAEKMINLQTNLVKKTKFPKVPKAGTLKKAIKIPRQKQILIDVTDTYLVLYPNNQKSSSLRFNAAKIMFDYGHYKKALARFQDTVRLGPSSPESKTTVRIVLTYFELNRNWFGLTTWSEKFIKFEQQLGKEMAIFIVEKLKKGMWQIALAYQAAKKYEKAAEAFIAYQKRLPTDKVADKALFNAMTLYFSLGNGKKGIAVGQSLLSTYPKSGFGANTLFAIGRAYQSLNQYRSAAEAYEKFSIRYPKDNRSPQVLYQAGQIYKGLNNLDRSSLLLANISAKYPNSSFAPKALLETAEIHLKLDQFNKAANAYQVYLNKYKNINAETTLFALAQVTVLTTPNIPSSANKPQLLQLETNLKTKPRKFAEKAREALTKFYLDITNALVLDFSQQKVAYYDFNEYQTSIQSYMQHIARLEGFFARLINIASVEGLTEAYYKLGTVYEQAMSALVKKWNMDCLREDEARDILNAKERITLSLRDKLVKSFQNAYEYARQNKVFTQYRNRSLEKLSQLLPSKYKSLKEGVMAPAPAK